MADALHTVDDVHHATAASWVTIVFLLLFGVCFLVLVFATPSYWPDYYSTRPPYARDVSFVEEEYVTPDGRRVHTQRWQHTAAPTSHGGIDTSLDSDDFDV